MAVLDQTKRCVGIEGDPSGSVREGKAAAHSVAVNPEGMTETAAWHIG